MRNKRYQYNSSSGNNKTIERKNYNISNEYVKTESRIPSANKSK